MKTLENCGLDPAALAVGVDWLTKRMKRPFTANASFAMVKPDGAIDAHENGACHGGMYGRDVELIATVSNWSTYRYESYSASYAKGIYRKVLPTAIGERFYDWFVNRSWAADYIVAPDQGFATYSGFMVSADTPANYVLAIMTMSRNAQEHAQMVHRMYDYVDEFGISEDLAYFLAFSLETANKYGSIIWNHNCFGQGNPEMLDNWMNRRIRQTNESYRSGGSHYGVTAMWGKTSPKAVEMWTDEFKAKAALDVVVIPNPFKPVVNTGTKTISEKFLHEIIPNIAAKYPENTNSERIAA